SAFICGSICFRAEAHEFEQAGCGAENDSANQTPRLGTEPLVEHPSEGTETGDCCEEGDACGVSEAGLSVLVLVRFIGQQLTSFRASGSSWERRKAKRDANGAWSRE